VRRSLAPLLVACTCAGVVAACGWDPSRPFDREAPAVNQAVSELDGGDAASAAAKLEDYLSTGACKDGNIGTPDLLAKRPDGTFDLGLECSRRVVEAIADDGSVPLDLRARARYLSGNLAFLDGDYEDAVRAYDRALVLAPGMVDGGDPLGRDAAWNRAIALRRIEDKKDAGQPDAGQDASQSPDASQEAGRDGSSGQDSGGGDGGQDAAQPPQQQPEAGPQQQPDAGQPPPPQPATNEDDRMLDQLENAPTLQQEEAKRAGKKRVRGMADK
jgi:tetratricopeptide (TPR) repeat protein